MENAKEVMPEAYEEKLALLDGIIRTGIEKLLVEARKKDFLKPPYGKNKAPTPLISETDFVHNFGADGVDDDDEPKFSYQYGFNPLKFLADYMLWSHPTNYQARKDNRFKSFERLKFRSRHANRQLLTSESLIDLADRQRSGVCWGPIISVVSPSSAICTCATVKAGTLKVQVATDDEFGNIVNSYKVTIQEDAIMTPSKIVIDGLKPGFKYFIRLCLLDAGAPDVDDAVDPEEDNASSDEEELGEGDDAPQPEQKEVLPPKFGGIGEGLFQESFFTTWQVEMEDQADDTISSPEKGKGDPAINNEHRHHHHHHHHHEPTDAKIALVAVGSYARTSFSASGFGGGAGGAKKVNPLLLDADTLESSGIITAGSFTTSCVLGDVLVDNSFQSWTDPPGTGNRSRPRTGVAESKSLDSLDGVAVAEAKAGGAGGGGGGGEDVTVSPDPSSGFIRSPLLWGAGSVFKQSSFALAWHDRSPGSDQALRGEEASLKQFSHDMRKYMKKWGDEIKKAATGRRAPTAAPIPPAPTHRQPEMTVSLQTVLQSMPVVLQPDKPDEPGVRRLYRIVPLCPEVDLFVVDVRGGYLGKQQAKWLRAKLEASQATWKIILSGQPCGVTAKAAPPTKPSTSQKDRRLSFAASIAAAGSDDAAGPGAGTGLSASESLDDKERPAAGRVQMMLPAAQDMDEVDEAGRPKSSLQYVLASMQRRADAAAKASVESGTVEGSAGEGGEGGAEGEGSTGLPTSASAASLDTASTSLAQNSEASAEEEERVQSIRSRLGGNTTLIAVEAGIVLLSSGPSDPFVATYDPTGWGKVYCMEVGVGSAFLNPASGTPAAVAPGEPIGWQLVDNMGAALVYGDESLDSPLGAVAGLNPDKPSVVVVQQEEDETLRIRVLSSEPVEDGSLEPPPAPVVAFEALLYTPF